MGGRHRSSVVIACAQAPTGGWVLFIVFDRVRVKFLWFQGGSCINKPGQKRLRIGRVSEPGRIYLITCVCHRRQPVFSDWRFGRCAVRALMSTDNQASSLAFVVMPDHLHWLMQLQPGSNLSRAVQKMKGLTSQGLKAEGCTTLPVWQRGFHDHALRREEDIREVARYVVANPLRAGLVDSIGDYPLWDACWL